MCVHVLMMLFLHYVVYAPGHSVQVFFETMSAECFLWVAPLLVCCSAKAEKKRESAKRTVQEASSSLDDATIQRDFMSESVRPPAGRVARARAAARAAATYASDAYYDEASYSNRCAACCYSCLSNFFICLFDMQSAGPSRKASRGRTRRLLRALWKLREDGRRRAVSLRASPPAGTSSASGSATFS